MDTNDLFSVGEMRVFNETLDFLEGVYGRRGEYQSAGSSEERTIDVLVLNFTKIVNDCRAILGLAEKGFYIQAGIVARSTMDACHLAMHIAVQGEEAALVRKWLEGGRLSHWSLVKRLNADLSGELDIDSYESVRAMLDDFVHGNYEALKLYPAQARGPTPLNDTILRQVTIWKELLPLYLVTCLLVVDVVVPDLKAEAQRYLSRLEQGRAPREDGG